MKLKVCGMKYNAEEVAALKPDYLGFIFWEPSVRYFNGPKPDLDSAINKVGVFVDAAYEEVVLRTFEYELQAIQLHGNESPEYCKKLKNMLEGQNSGMPQIIKAFAIDNHFDFGILTAYEKECDYFLFDTRDELPGGTGKKFNWRILKKYHLEKPYFLSGGISPEDIDSLKEFLQEPEARFCYAIDLNSKFEKEPGLKDEIALKNFILNIEIFKKEAL